MNSSRIIQSLYTDGACSGNPGPGGWGVVAYFEDGSVYELGDREETTTNNRMEMQAAIAALKILAASRQTDPVTLYTDSEYVKKGITLWVKGWRKKGWKTSQGQPVLNQDLWELLDELNTRLGSQLNTPVQWQYVRGHAGNVGNERCDAIARAFAAGRTPSLQQSASTEDEFGSQATKVTENKTIQSSSLTSDSPVPDLAMVDSTTPSIAATENFENLPREVRIAQLTHLIETLRIADEISGKGYLITSSELADLMDVNASAVTSRGDHWVWRNWIVSRVRREGNQILWQLEKVDS
jgi:ribonuclease HI